MKKRFAAILCASALALMALSGCGAKAPAAGQGGTSSDRSKFTVGFDAEFPPYGYMNDAGEYVGFDLDMARAICEDKGWEFVAQPIDWDAKDMELNSGSIDCIWNGFTINGREDAYTWTVPYIDNSQVFVTASDSGIKSQADLSGKNVGVQKDSSALAALEDEENAALAASFSELRQYSDYNSAFMDLEAGAIDALAIDIGVANYQLAQRGDAYIMLDEALATEQYGVGFKLGNEALRDEIQEAMMKLHSDGRMEKLAAEYGIDASMICLK